MAAFSGNFYNNDMTKVERAAREFRLDMEKFLNFVVETPFSKLPKAQQSAWKKRDQELHPSSFPYCGLRNGFERLQRRDQDFTVGRKFADDFYLNIGTVVHTALQLWLGKGKKLIGNWKCLACKKVHKIQIEPNKCRRCKHDEFAYEEIGGSFKNTIWWHSDGLFKDKNGRYWVIDYKTTSVSAIEEHRKTGERFPYKSNKIQIETYCLLLEKELNIKVSGWMLVYISRDLPIWKNEVVAQAFDRERREVVSHHMKTSIKMFPLELQATREKDFKELAANKLCSSHRYYREQIHDDFSPCPLHKRCFKKDKLEKKISKTVKEYQERHREIA